MALPLPQRPSERVRLWPVRPAQPPPVPSALHFVPPSVRELRAQSVHRVQVGLAGLAAMLLLVGLANIIMDRARQSDAGTVTTSADRAASGTPSANSDPMVDIGVAPDLPSSSTPASAGPAAPRPR